MIAKGNLHAHGTKLAAYLTAGKDGERAELLELRGFVADNIRDAFIDVQIQAAGTRATKPFFHAYVRLPEGEGLGRERWRAVADRIEQRLGFDGQPRAVAFHHGPDGTHMHVAWSRIDLETMKAIDPGLYKNRLKEVCRELEAELDLTRVRSERDADEKAQAPARDEFEQSRRLGTDIKAIRSAIRDCWDRADNGRAFAAALDERGLILARGDRRDFVVVDEAGGDHALGKKVTGATAAATRARLADLDPKTLPGVDAAKALQQQRAQERQAMEEESERVRRAAAEEARQQEARRAEEQQQAEARRIEEERREEQRKAEEARAAAAMSDAERQAQRNADRLVEQAEQLRQDRERLDAYEKTLAEEARRAREAKAREEIDAQHRTDRERAGVRDAGERYSQALGQHYDVRDPYGSLARAAMAEHAAFRRDRVNLDRQIEAEKDPAKRERLELRQKIELADYMAITSNRIAQQSDVITGRAHSAEAQTQRERAAAFQAEGARLRAELRDRTAAAEKPPATPEPAKPQDAARDEAAPRQDGRPAGAEQRPPPQTVVIVNQQQPEQGQTQPQQAADPYVRLATDELAKRGSEPPPRQFSPVEFARNPAARTAYYEQQAAEQERIKERNLALDRMQKDLEANKPIQGRDVRKLSREDLKNIREKGGSHIRELIKERAKERDKERGKDSGGEGRERDRP
jgi:hypothetical protein